MKKVQATPRSRHTTAIPCSPLLLDKSRLWASAAHAHRDAPPSLDSVYGQPALQRYTDGSGTGSHPAHGRCVEQIARGLRVAPIAVDYPFTCGAGDFGRSQTAIRRSWLRPTNASGDWRTSILQKSALHHRYPGNGETNRTSKERMVCLLFRC